MINKIKEDLSKMNSYERWRLKFLLIQVILTVGAPFIAVWVNKNWN